jgi:methylase of polypeptide subunit release factors
MRVPEAIVSAARARATDKSPRAVELTRRDAERFGVLDRIAASQACPACSPF